MPIDRLTSALAGVAEAEGLVRDACRELSCLDEAAREYEQACETAACVRALWDSLDDLRKGQQAAKRPA